MGSHLAMYGNPIVSCSPYRYLPIKIKTHFISKILVHRIGLSRQWQIAYGHIEEEERLKARIAKKEKAMTQIEMDIHVQDMG